MGDAQTICAGIFNQSMGARNQVGIGLSYRPVRLHTLGASIRWNRLLGSLKVKKIPSLEKGTAGKGGGEKMA